MPKDIMPKITYCPKTLCPIWQFAQKDILPKDFMPKVTICPKRTLCPRWYFAHIFEGFCPRIFGNIQKWKEIVTQSQNAWWVFFGLKLAFFANFWENLCKIMGFFITKTIVMGQSSLISGQICCLAEIWKKQKYSYILYLGKICPT